MSFEGGENGCVLEKNLFNGAEFIINVKSHDGLIDISTGKKQRSVRQCFTDKKFAMLRSKGFLGMTARNALTSIKDIDLNVMKVVN